MGSGAVIYVPSFIKIGSGIQKLTGGYTDTRTNTHTHTHTDSNVISKPTLFFKIRKVG
jgi:hypothetical protein